MRIIMKKIVSVFCIFTFIFSAICAKPKYISPNNDGVQDELEIPLQISDKRYVQGWSLVIMNEQKEIVDYLDEKCAALDTLIAKKTALLTELETYKKSLIYEYVTGKKEDTV